ncbi:SRPBCC family protein [Algoriphagus machipongonensis]|uniref:Activator of Hsp90 ATPase homologue 1/2-like C-terminal domain-containing protein n=1 Tax=Algoriphagus machipongonensis TaxID=388413 RepID=A3HXT4_9BACT|nr:SRPBCC domain-containing protein [Algoriphagus machipongonensis]EAZ81407.1 hypothetical protein ALPR1_20263 [Algoriphagus machipongonensis]
METTDKQTFGIYHTFWIRSTISKVFSAISSPEQLILWWPQKCSGKPEIGESYNFYFTPEYDWFGTVSKVEENKAFHIKMVDSDKDWDPTSFGFELEEDGTMVKVSFWHKGWENQNEHFKISSYCWAILLQGLKNYLEKGEVLPFEERS